MCLGIDTRYFHRYIINVGLFESFEIRLITLVGLAVAEHHLAQQVDVLTDILAEAGSQVLGQVGTCGIDNHTAGVAAQAPLDDGNSHPVEEGQIGKLLVHPEQGMVGLVEEMGNAVLVDQVFHTNSQLLGVAHLTGLVEHAHDKLLVARGGDHGAVHVLLFLLQLGQSGITLIV